MPAQVEFPKSETKGAAHSDLSTLLYPSSTNISEPDVKFVR